MIHEKYLKGIVQKTINAYRKLLKGVEEEDKDDKRMSGYYTGIIFGMGDALEHWNVEKMKECIDVYKEVYIKQEDRYKCGYVEGVSMVMRIIDHDEQMHDQVGMLIGATSFNTGGGNPLDL